PSFVYWINFTLPNPLATGTQSYLHSYCCFPVRRVVAFNIHRCRLFTTTRRWWCRRLRSCWLLWFFRRCVFLSSNIFFGKAPAIFALLIYLCLKRVFTCKMEMFFWFCLTAIH